MLHGEPENKKFQHINPSQTLAIYDDIEIPKYRLRDESTSAEVAYRLIKNELLDEGNARLNLATFCTTFMEDEATALMTETLNKNAIDKSEYPSTIELENRCVNMIAGLWHAPETGFAGTSTVGSSEACMLAGLAMKFRWRKRAQRLGLDVCAKKPNLVVSAGYQVCWEKFCVYWDVELRAVPMMEPELSLDAGRAVAAADEYTIGIVGILGQTYTGKYDDIAALDWLVEEHNRRFAHKLYIHVDAASGGLYTPFVDPDLPWDFRLKNVVSINVSGHKYGLVYPGVGWIVWRSREYLPDELVFEVDYLGGRMPTMAINFSRSASQIVGQYYNFLRLGFLGYEKVHTHTRRISRYIAGEIDGMDFFEIINAGDTIPVVCFKLKENKARWTLYDLSDKLQMSGWQVPVYALPRNMENTVVMRVVCRSDMSLNLAEHFIDDFRHAVHTLTLEKAVIDDKNRRDTKGFTH